MDEAGSASAPGGQIPLPVQVDGITPPALGAGERQLRAVLDNSPVVSFIADAWDRVVYQNAPGRNRCGAGSEVLGRPVAELLPEEHVAGMLAALRRVRSTGVGETVTFTGRVRSFTQVRGHLFPLPGPPAGMVGVVGLDVTELANSQRELTLRAQEESALRRVATLVAAEAGEPQVFESVTEEVARLLGAQTSNLLRYDGGDRGTVLAGWSEPGVSAMPAGTEIVMDSPTLAAIVYRTGRATRIDSYQGLPGQLAARLRAMELCSSVGAPIMLQGKLWGMVTASTTRPRPLPPDAEQRISHFAELVTQALANNQARRELAASRQRLVAAADTARRKIERDLHDGAQQRLLGLALRLQLARRRLGDEPSKAARLLDEALIELTATVDDVRELARGIHPVVLTEQGLAAALRALVSRATVPTRLRCSVNGLPPAVEAALYFVCSEAIANVHKHAQASTIDVTLRETDGQVVLEVVDDGVGAAQVRPGGGLEGLRDRVEALGGRLKIGPGEGRGNRLRARLPIRDEGPAHLP